jgi:hypothetical protein
MGLGADAGVEGLDVDVEAAQDRGHLPHDPRPVLADQAEGERLANGGGSGGFDGGGDAHLEALGVDRAHSGEQAVDPVGLEGDQHGTDVEAAEPAEMALEPVAAGRQDRARERLGEPGPVAANHAQDHRCHRRSQSHAGRRQSIRALSFPA